MEKTITVEIPEGFTKEEIQKILEKVKKKANIKKVPYIGYGCGKKWEVKGTRYEDAKSNATDAFIEELKDVLPPNIKKNCVDWAIGVKKFGPEWNIPLDEAVKQMIALHNAKTRRYPR